MAPTNYEKYQQDLLIVPPEVQIEFVLNGYECMIRRPKDWQTLRGYIRLPKTHPDYNKNCYDADIQFTGDVHGGLSFGYSGWGFGIDFDHENDYNPIINDKRKEEFKYWAFADVFQELKKLANGFKEHEAIYLVSQDIKKYLADPNNKMSNISIVDWTDYVSDSFNLAIKLSSLKLPCIIRMTKGIDFSKCYDGQILKMITEYGDKLRDNMKIIVKSIGYDNLYAIFYLTEIIKHDGSFNHDLYRFISPFLFNDVLKIVVCAGSLDGVKTMIKDRKMYSEKENFLEIARLHCRNKDILDYLNSNDHKYTITEVLNMKAVEPGPQMYTYSSTILNTNGTYKLTTVDGKTNMTYEVKNPDVGAGIGKIENVAAKTDAPKTENVVVKNDAPKTDAPKTENVAPKTENVAVKTDALKTENVAVKTDAPKTENVAPKPDAPKTDAPKLDAPKTENVAVKTDAPTPELPVTDTTPNIITKFIILKNQEKNGVRFSDRYVPSKFYNGFYNSYEEAKMVIEKVQPYRDEPITYYVIKIWFNAKTDVFSRCDLDDTHLVGSETSITNNIGPYLYPFRYIIVQQNKDEPGHSISEDLFFNSLLELKLAMNFNSSTSNRNYKVIKVSMDHAPMTMPSIQTAFVKSNYTLKL